MSQLRGVESKEEALCIELENARVAVDLTLRELTKLIDEREAIKSELATVRAGQTRSGATEDEFLVPWGFCEDDD